MIHSALRKGLVWALVVSVVGVFPVTTALLADVNTSSQNSLAGGTLDIKLTETGPATQDSTTDETQEDTTTETWEDLSHDETLGESPVTNTLTLDNSESSIDATRVNVSISYTENDTSLGTAGNPDATARTIRILEFTYDGTDLVGTEIADENGNGRIDLEDVTLGETKQNLTSLPGVPVDDPVDLTISFDGDRSLLSLVVGGDGLDIDIEIRSHSTFIDRDVSKDNTIRYAVL